MTNLEQYNAIFIQCLEVEESQLGENLTYQSIPEWDSVGHMQLISALEDEFDLMLDTDDIIDFSSYVIGKEILKKNGVDI